MDSETDIVRGYDDQHRSVKSEVKFSRKLASWDCVGGCADHPLREYLSTLASMTVHMTISRPEMSRATLFMPLLQQIRFI